MKKVILFLAFAATAAHGEPRAKSAEECVVYADLALVASALAKHGVARERAHAMMPDMYSLADTDAKEIARRIVEAAYLVPEDARREPRAFAATLAGACMRSQGRLDAIIGVSL
jgi:hypothetical protein